MVIDFAHAFARFEFLGELMQSPEEIEDRLGILEGTRDFRIASPDAYRRDYAQPRNCGFSGLACYERDDVAANRDRPLPRDYSPRTMGGVEF